MMGFSAFPSLSSTRREQLPPTLETPRAGSAFPSLHMTKSPRGEGRVGCSHAELLSVTCIIKNLSPTSSRQKTLYSTKPLIHTNSQLDLGSVL
ncbi:hypothetical protein AOLI_G00131900 [Acnodon oligacanthus]